AAYLRRVRGAGGDGALARPRAHPRDAARAGLGGLRLPRLAHRRRPHPPPAGEAGAGPALSRVSAHRARRGLPVPRQRGIGPLILGSVRNRLAVAFFVITAAAIGFVYVYVVPQLRSNLTAQKLHRL